MIFSPKYAIDQGWVTGIKNDWQIQPNAVEFTLDFVDDMSENTTFFAYDDVAGKTHKQHRGGNKLQAAVDRSSEVPFFTLTKGVYDGMSEVYVDLPENVLLLLIIRSTFNRNGIFLTSGLYDSGYKGHIGFAIHNWVGPAKIGQGTRIGQAMFVQADSVGMYAGGYNFEQGKHWKD